MKPTCTCQSCPQCIGLTNYAAIHVKRVTQEQKLKELNAIVESAESLNKKIDNSFALIKAHQDLAELFLSKKDFDGFERHYQLAAGHLSEVDGMAKMNVDREKKEINELIKNN